MIFGVGIDIIEVSRLDQEWHSEESKENFIAAVFTDREIAYCEQKKYKARHYAARYALKESFFKALGTGWRYGMTWKEVEVLNDDLGKPELCIHGKAEEYIRAKNISAIHVSLSHIKEIAVAVVILELTA
ncbi:holo-ACP synthase [bacterium]|nr:holo-ACP synthase [bacterium]